MLLLLLLYCCYCYSIYRVTNVHTTLLWTPYGFVSDLVKPYIPDVSIP